MFTKLEKTNAKLDLLRHYILIIESNLMNGLTKKQLEDIWNYSVLCSDNSELIVCVEDMQKGEDKLFDLLNMLEQELEETLQTLPGDCIQHVIDYLENKQITKLCKLEISIDRDLITTEMKTPIQKTED